MRRIFPIILLLISIKVSLAIGVGPAFNKIEFQPSLNQTYSFKVYNTDSKDFYATILVEGSHAEYIHVQDNVHIPPGEPFKKIPYNVDLPSILKPGEHQTKIRVIEVPAGINGTGAVGAALGVSHKITISVPAEGKYLDVQIKVINRQLEITVTNLGDQRVQSAIVDFTLLDGDREVLFSSEKLYLLNPGAKRIITKNLGALDIGQYNAKVNLDFDGIQRSFEKIILIGKITVTVNKISVKEFNLGDIAKIDVEVENKWNLILSDMYIDLEVTKDGKPTGSYKSENFNLNPKSVKTISTYWDTSSKEPGNYEATFTIHFAGQTLVETYSLTLAENKIQVTKKQPEMLLALILIAIILGIVAVVAAISYFKRKKEPFEIHY